MPVAPGIATAGTTPNERLTTDALVAVVACAPCGIIIVDEAGRIVSVNSRACGDFGYESTELLGHEIEILVT